MQGARRPHRAELHPQRRIQGQTYVTFKLQIPAGLLFDQLRQLLLVLIGIKADDKHGDRDDHQQQDSAKPDR